MPEEILSKEELKAQIKKAPPIQRISKHRGSNNHGKKAKRKSVNSRGK